MPKVQAGTSKKWSHHCDVEISSTNWSKHIRTQRHISRQSAHIQRAVSEDDDDFQLASPTVVPGPSSLPTQRDDEVLQIIMAKAKQTGARPKKTGTGGGAKGKPSSGGEKIKRDKASTNFLITAHSKRKYVYARCLFHWSKCYIIGREFNNGRFGRKAHLHIFVKLELKMKVKYFKEKMVFHGLRVNDIQPCKHPDSAIKYITKEDRIPYNCGVDWSKFNWLCKHKVIAEEMEYVDNTHPAVVSIPHIYRSTFRNYHSQFWNEMNRGLLFDITDEPVNIDKYYRIKGFFSVD